MTESLEARVDRLESMEEIRKLKYQYCYYCDQDYDPEGIASLFAEDGIWSNGNTLTPTVGRKAIADSFRDVSKSIPFAAHIVMNPIVEVNGDTATGRWWLMMPSTNIVDDAPKGHWLVAEYEDDYVRVNGKWYFKKLTFFQKFWTAATEDWAAASIASKAEAQ